MEKKETDEATFQRVNSSGTGSGGSHEITVTPQVSAVESRTTFLRQL